MKYLLIGFLIIFAYKALSNLARLLMVKSYRNKYSDYISKKNFDFAIYTASVKKLFQRAGISDVLIPLCEPIGFGQVVTANVSLFNNMSALRNDVPPRMFSCFSKAEGVFRMRLKECFSPLYWIECIIFLPKKLIGYIGLNEDSVVAKLLQVIYWIASPLLIAFRSDIYNYILDLLAKAQ